MALVSSILKGDLLSAFQSMNNGDNRIFSDKVAAACKKFAESGSISTTDAGAVAAGAFSGSGTGDITCKDAPCADTIYTACQIMNGMDSGGDAYLADKMAAAIHNMVLTGTVSCDVTGTVIPPSGGSSPLSGTATGILTGVSVPMQTAFIAAFNTMYGMDSGGDEYLAGQIALAVDAYLKAGIVTTKGSGALSGDIGAGKMT